jgi:L-lactate dehydrogenase complex protein LldG
MTEREKIFARIREALTVPAPFPGQHNGHKPAPSPTPAGSVREWLPGIGASFDEQLARFRENAAALKADFHSIQSRDEFASTLVRLRDAEGWKKIATHAGALTDAACGALDLPVCRTDESYDVNELEACDVGITECDALIAQFGSVLVTSRSAGGRALSVLPPHHVVLARRGQLLPDLTAAFDLLRTRYGGNFPSMISFITGPSRTGDIERILVLGAHGPKRLTILFLAGEA